MMPLSRVTKQLIKPNSIKRGSIKNQLEMLIKARNTGGRHSDDATDAALMRMDEKFV